MTTEMQDEHLPISSFYFRLEWGSQDNLDFQEASGLQTEIEPIDYRKNDSALSARKLPGMVLQSPVILRRGYGWQSNNFWDWHNKITRGTIERRDVTIRLMDNHGNATMEWRLINAFPSKISELEMPGTGNKVAIESLELTCEGLDICTPNASKDPRFNV